MLKIIELLLLLLTPIIGWIDRKLSESSKPSEPVSPKKVLAEGLHERQAEKIAESFQRLKDKEARLRRQFELARAKKEKDNAEADK